MSASYRLLQDHYLSNQLVPSGTVVTEGGLIPNGWVPTGNVEPLNSDAVNAFYAAGPQLMGLIQSPYGQAVGPPITYWKKVGGFGSGFAPGFLGQTLYQLTGLGILLSPKALPGL